MTLSALINGEPAEIEIPNGHLIEPLSRGALDTVQTCLYLGCSSQKLWLLAETGEIDKTSYGTFIVQSLNEHLARERERWQAKKKITRKAA